MTIVQFRRHTIGSVNAELINAGLFLRCSNGLYSFHKRKRGQEVGDRIRFLNSKMDAYDMASDLINNYNKLKGEGNDTVQTLKNKIFKRCKANS